MAEMQEKWGEAVAGRGFAQIPNYLLLLNQFLDAEERLSPVEIMILLQLAGAWWEKDKLPFPSISTLAARCGVSDRQAQRAVTNLDKIGLINRVKRKSGRLVASNAYDMQPLVDFLAKVAKEFPNEFVRKKRMLSLKEVEEAE